MIYLACPYSHYSGTVRNNRFLSATHAAVYLMEVHKEAVFSPITHSHPMNELGISGDFATWIEMDLSILSLCSKLVVLKLDGWEKSIGVATEILEAQRLSISIEYLDWKF